MKLNKIRETLYLKDLLQEVAAFQCVDFGDKIINYEVNLNDGLLHEIILIDDATCFFPKEKVVHLIERNNIQYFQYTIYLQYEDGNHDKIEQYEYAPLREKADRL